MGSGCGPARVLTAFSLLNEGNSAKDARGLFENALKTLEHSHHKKSVIGRTDHAGRRYLEEQLNNVRPQGSILLKTQEIDRDPSDLIAAIDDEVKEGHVVMVGVGQQYLLETIKTEIPRVELM